MRRLPRFCRPIVIVAALFLVACSGDAVAPGSRLQIGSAAYGKAAPNALAVSGTAPSYGDQGTTVDIHIIGSGFAPGAVATWLLRGAADPAHVHTNSTTYVSSTELVANITIAADAQLDLWDVQVFSGGKNGVGSECFEVTSAEILGPGTPGAAVQVRMMNDQGQVVGWTSTPVAWVYGDALGMVNLGSGSARGIDESGTIVLGDNGSSLATAWIRQPDNTWTPEVLPRLSGSATGRAMSAALQADGTLLVPGFDQQAPKRGTSAGERPLAWRRINGSWTAPQLYAIPPGASYAEPTDANSVGEVVGQTDATLPGVIWESPTTYAQLDGWARKINRAGTLIVGQKPAKSDHRAVFWWKDPTSHSWHTTGIELPTLAGPSCLTGDARGVNDDGVIVGDSCNSAGIQQATVWLVDLSSGTPVLVGTPAGLPGLGKNDASAADVTNTRPYVVAGAASQSGTRLAVRWQLR